MTCITDFWNRLDKFEKVLVLSTIILAAGILVAACFYSLFGKTLIEKMYYGQTWDSLNNLIKYQHKHPLEHYLSQGPLLFKRIVFLSVAFYLFISGFSFFAYRLIFSDKKAHLAIVILLPVLAVILLYYLNPSFRVLSFHGFYRAGIVYQIINGYVPPLDPLFADYTVHSPWGFPWLIAMSSKVFNISPFYSFALSNIICLVLTSIGIYTIAGLVYKNQKARLFAVLISIYAITPFPRGPLTSIQSLFHNQSTEFRTTPIFLKFMTVNGNPVGVVFFVLFLYAIIKLLRDGGFQKYTPLLFISFLGAGFLYPPILPALGASLVILILLRAFPIFKRFNQPWKATFFMCLVLILGAVVLRPYFLTISSGVRSNIHFLDPVFVYKNTVNFLVPLSPLLLIIFCTRKKLVSSVETEAGIILLIIIASSTLCFIGIHILDSAEYKFLGLAGICIGILGGKAFEILVQKNKWAVLILIILFTLPSIDYYSKFLFRNNHPIKSVAKAPYFHEKGTEIFVRNTEEAELYHWIKQNTSPDQLFIDTTLRLPVYAQRRLLIGIDGLDGREEMGYGIAMNTLALRSGYTKNEFDFRTKIVRNLYGLESTLDRKRALEYLARKDVLIVLRKNGLTPSLQRSGLHEIFRSSCGKYLVYDAL